MIVGLFSAVNESIWEHLKLLFFPMFVYAIIESKYFKMDYNNFWCIKLRGIVSGVMTVPVLYYIIMGVFGGVPDWVNILIFFEGIGTAYFLEDRLFRKDNLSCKLPVVAFVALCLIAVVFAIFTINPPEIPLFEDPGLH